VDDSLVAAANDTVYGLAAGVWSRDIARANQLVNRIKAGTVDQLLPCLRQRPAFWRLQAVGLGPRDGLGSVLIKGFP
jgi:hypothetical protein